MMMRGALLCAAIVSAGAATLKLGYGLGNGDLRFSLPSKGAPAAKTYTVMVEKWMLQNSTMMGVQLKTGVTTVDCSACVTTMKMDLNWRMVPPTGTPGTWIPVSTCQGQSFGTDNRCWFPTSIEGTYEFNVNLTCSQCSKSAELSRMEIAVTTNKALPDFKYGGFNFIDDRNADYYEGSRGNWGPVVKIPTTQSSDKVYILPEVAGLSRGAGVVYYFMKESSNMSWPAALALHDAPVSTCVMASTGCTSIAPYEGSKAMFPRAPNGMYSSGDFPVDAYDTPTGHWLFRGLVTKKPTTKNDADFRFAIGLNHPPASAAGLIPNFVVVTLVTLAAFLR